MSHAAGAPLRHLFVVRPYSSGDQPFVRELLGRSDPDPDRDHGEWLSLLGALGGQAWARPPVIAMVLWTSSSLSGLALAEAFRDMPDRWMVLCLMVDPAFRRQGQATALLTCLEREVYGCGGRCLGVELPSSQRWDESQRFVLRRGYDVYDGMGLGKRFPMSRYFVKDLGKNVAPSSSKSGRVPPRPRATN